MIRTYATKIDNSVCVLLSHSQRKMFFFSWFLTMCKCNLHIQSVKYTWNRFVVIGSRSAGHARILQFAHNVNVSVWCVCISIECINRGNPQMRPVRYSIEIEQTETFSESVWTLNTAPVTCELRKRSGRLFHGLLDNSPTNQLAVSQVADWSTRGLVNSWTSQLADEEFVKITEKLHYIW